MNEKPRTIMCNGRKITTQKLPAFIQPSNVETYSSCNNSFILGLDKFRNFFGCFPSGFQVELLLCNAVQFCSSVASAATEAEKYFDFATNQTYENIYARPLKRSCSTAADRHWQSLKKLGRKSDIIIWLMCWQMLIGVEIECKFECN